jgi:prepilin-type N-terminal cleavage/methylation domain-containing protein
MLPARRDRRLFFPFGCRRQTSRAFTLIELLLVTAIIVALAAFAVGGIIGAKQRAAIARSKAELALLAQALEDYNRHYGDYPQTGAAAQASPTITGTAVIGSTQAQALLFNALTGVYAPTNFTTRINGPTFVDVSKFSLEAALNPTTFAVPTGSPPTKPLVANAFLDPWGNRYLYYYKNPRNAAAWPVGHGFVLYSAGPDGAQTPPNVNTGLYTGATQTTGANADNHYADKLP